MANPNAALPDTTGAGAAAAGVTMKPAMMTNTRPPTSSPVSQFWVLLDARVLTQWMPDRINTTRQAYSAVE